ncbi:MAG: flagellar basal body L-ring protein FlgH [Candidatus Krumholzibacteria bacterium]|jgi:flagellar L-ring protein precursor FlgH|nr:flagellar basal body L-ring protein FlgH [Candidatus Krumholzibacteria bacterium]MDP6669039.1 flagellar basal body L-ring protein FlgH [Candidatus Krumholzibacteria bacterium]MDP6797459.1 flagellar basal body L-ring protein FlgH [Candidatus Krumholzibacteria bacterium]MDP7020978.1 flagellar basal body L-ring protein FlgH [Candidatus Krumholzibacteria bacterium]
MSKRWFLILLLALSTSLQAEALWDDSSGGSLYSNQKAHRVGDILTVMISESATAVSDAITDTEVKNEMSGGAGTGLLDFIPLWGLNQENRFEGKGTSARKADLKAVMSVRIVQELPRGQFRVEGERSVSRNGEEDVLTLSGVVRGRDIGPDNSVPSSAIAEAIIVYEGKGDLEQSNRPGLLSRFADWIF